MATYDLAFATRLDDVVVLQTFVGTDIQTADSVTIVGAPSGMSGTFTVLSVEPFAFLGVDDDGDLLFDSNIIRENQFLYRQVGADIARDTATGTVEFAPSVAWIAASDVVAWLGIDSATANDTAFISVCVNAANPWAFRKRREAGYTDSQAAAPSGDVKLATVMFAAMQYRSRGAVDSYASFDQFGNAAPSMSLGQIYSLLGTGRPQVA